MDANGTEKLLLRPAEVADVLGLGRSKVYAMIGAGEIPSLRIGSRVRVPVESLRSWVRERAAMQGA